MGYIGIAQICKNKPIRGRQDLHKIGMHAVLVGYCPSASSIYA